MPALMSAAGLQRQVRANCDAAERDGVSDVRSASAIHLARRVASRSAEPTDDLVW